MRSKMSPASARASASRRARFKQPFDLRVIAVLVVVSVVVSVSVFVSVIVFVFVGGVAACVGVGVPWLFWPGQVDVEALADEGAALALAECDAEAADAHRLDG